MEPGLQRLFLGAFLALGLVGLIASLTLKRRPQPRNVRLVFRDYRDVAHRWHWTLVDLRGGVHGRSRAQGYRSRWTMQIARNALTRHLSRYEFEIIEVDQA